ncbi:IS1595 family transposase [Candidatus Gottesmanbacteria bacterium]|nr:IS1595 family transposase [Candidatus Gottesmanbacteria bacterium]
MKQFSLKTFLRKYPNDEACLEEIKNTRWPQGITCPKCQKITKFYKITDRTAYSCEFCRTQVFPLAGTIFEKSTVSLRLWFYAMFLMIKTRSGISAKQLERELGVCYKTAHRIFKQIRMLMDEGNGDKLTGNVEVDETFIGGRGVNRRYKPNFSEIPKEVVMGMIQRNGKAYLRHIPNTGKWTLLKQIRDNVDVKARVITDQWLAYGSLPKYGYKHDFVNHQETYVKGDIHTQNAEMMWSILKRDIYGVYRHVSAQYLQNYANEYAWRYNHRNSEDMFTDLLKQIALVKVVKAKQLV